MRRLTVLFLMLWMGGVVALAQPSRREVTNATTPEQDMRSNSPSVPDVYAIDGNLERLVILRFKYQTDLLAGLEKMVKEQLSTICCKGVKTPFNEHYRVTITFKLIG